VKKIAIKWYGKKEEFDKATGPTPHRKMWEEFQSIAKFDKNNLSLSIPRSVFKAKLIENGFDLTYDPTYGYAENASLALLYVRSWLTNLKLKA